MSDNEFTPINILWIEDNPLFNAKKCSDLTNKDGEAVFDSSVNDVMIPAIALTDDLSNYEKFFNLKVLQHPEEIKEYYSLNLMIEDKYGSKELGSVEGAVPEIVVFDYKLSENITPGLAESDTHSINYTESKKAIRRYINPNFGLIERYKDNIGNFELFLEKPENIGYSTYTFIKRIYAPDQLNDVTIRNIKFLLENDDFGLFSGIEIVKFFRNHACIGIPATANKEDKTRLHPLSRYYEWLNEKDLSTSLHRKKRGDKTWNSILKDGMKQLRKRIIVLVQCEKLIPSYEQLMRLSKSPSAERVFSFITSYGERHLPLDGLFCDVEEELRDKRIKVWVKILIKCLSRKHREINEAVKVSNDIWEVYTKKFGERLELSNLAYWKSIRDLDTTEEERFEQLKNAFCNEKGEIQPKTSIRESFKGVKDELNFTVRLAVLHLVTRTAITMNKCKNRELGEDFFREFDTYEYFNLLFPIVKVGDDFVLPIHAETDKDKLVENDRNRILKKLGVSIKDWLNFKVWITSGEKWLLKSLFFSQDDYYPNWLI